MENISSYVQNTINKLTTQITNVYAAFIQHTKYFFINNSSSNSSSNSTPSKIDATINVSGDINLLSENNTINLNNNNLRITFGDTPPNSNNYALGSLFISTSGNLYIKQSINGSIRWNQFQTISN